MKFKCSSLSCVLFKQSEDYKSFFSLTSSSLYYIHAQLLSCVQLFVTAWTVAHQALLFVEFPRQEYGRGLPFSFPGHLPDSEIKLVSLVAPALAGGFSTTEPATCCLLILLNLLNYCFPNSLLLFIANACLDVLTSLLTPTFYTQCLPLSPLPFFLKYVFWGWRFSWVSVNGKVSWWLFVCKWPYFCSNSQDHWWRI